MSTRRHRIHYSHVALEFAAWLMVWIPPNGGTDVRPRRARSRELDGGARENIYMSSESLAGYGDLSVRSEQSLPRELV